LGYWARRLLKTPPQQCITSLFTVDGRRDISLQKPPRTCDIESGYQELVGRTSLQFFHRYAPTAHPVQLGSLRHAGSGVCRIHTSAILRYGQFGKCFPAQRCSNPNKTMRIAYTMILINFFQHTVFSAIFNGANNPSRNWLKHHLLRENCHVIPQVLRCILR
jgi:hypothetical protein